VSEYVRLVGLMVAAFGIAFEFPVLLVFLQLVGVLTPQTLIKGWRYAILTVFVIAAVITPSGDPYSMMALALPMTFFYLIAVLIGYIIQKRKRAAQTAAT
jgi:sec-independent protein translocase protein TatC